MLRRPSVYNNYCPTPKMKRFKLGSPPCMLYLYLGYIKVEQVLQTRNPGSMIQLKWSKGNIQQAWIRILVLGKRYEVRRALVRGSGELRYCNNYV